MERAKRNVSRNDVSQDKTRAGPAGSRTETKIADESELGSDLQGDSLDRDDQANRRNHRKAMPDAGG